MNATVLRHSSYSCSIPAPMAYLHASIITNIFFFGSNCLSTGALIMAFLGSWKARLAVSDQLNGTLFVNSVRGLAISEIFRMNLRL